MGGLERKREVGRGGGGAGGGGCIDLTSPLRHPAATLTLPQSLTSEPLIPPSNPPSLPPVEVVQRKAR